MFRLMFMLFGFMLSWMLDTDDGGDPPDDPPKDPPDDPPAKPYLAFDTKQEHDDYLETTLKERLERKDRKLAEQKEATERAAREKALEEQGEYKSIANQRQETIVEKDATISEKDTRIAELEADLEAMKPHRESNEARAKEMMENVPESVKELLADRDPLKQLEWLDKNPELSGVSNGKPKGSPATGPVRRKNNDASAEQDEAAKQQHRQGAHAAM